MPVYVAWLLILVESLSELGGQPAILYPEKKIYDIPAFPQTTGAELTENLLTQLKRFEDRVSIHLKEEVQTFEKTDGIFTIATSKGQHLSKAIVIACGNWCLRPTSLGVDNEEDYADNNLFYNVHSLDQFAGKKLWLLVVGIQLLTGPITWWYCWECDFDSPSWCLSCPWA